MKAEYSLHSSQLATTLAGIIATISLARITWLAGAGGMEGSEGNLVILDAGRRPAIASISRALSRAPAAEEPLSWQPDGSFAVGGRYPREGGPPKLRVLKHDRYGVLSAAFDAARNSRSGFDDEINYPDVRTVCPC